jgi:ribosomal RNA-processing protein 7
MGWASNVSLPLCPPTSTSTSASRRTYLTERAGYKSHLALLHPAPSLLSSTTNAYLSQFDAAAATRNRALAHLRSVPDEDGFITVTRGGGRNAPAARLEIAQQKQEELEDRKKKKGSLDGFYRFQNREKRKEQEGMLRKQFEKDRRRVVEMRERRGKVRLES